ncbi:MAG: MerR family transcriptional regulator [Vicinamibacterales bacterium]|jgi:DNA-binding transcriptional MerR regulator|nr:MerR family transcriptional regulator [Acidobacteriota bacterium]MDP6373051.1 MerR family transcriptional regulator [Vicinamibacterales bacterium]MDP6610119.1 MerR family transcriptional regulator [Vicinamibacterales bacterium]HAK55334.1 MerR family transcriptional regulator [Acidobacteriota bacterium]|tara:strand:- start:12 stop:500 length:489 start_codon:yes stop_codon:yes gene_type:complete
MSSTATPDIPKRAAFKSIEVCQIAEVKPYVLRSWEAEFPNLGVAKGSGPRVYRRADLELVLRLKELLFVDGLTLGGARRRLEEELGPIDEPVAEVDAAPTPIDRGVKRQLAEFKTGLRDILAMLSTNGDGKVPAAREKRGARGGKRPAARGRKGKTAKRTGR